MSVQLTSAMILAAGLGTRMRPLTLTKPKPLIEVGGKALIDWNLDWLAAAGIERVVINSSYLAEQLEAHIAKRAHPQIQISREGEPALETGGGIAKALPLLEGDVFLTLNSDALLTSDANGTHPIHQLVQAWRDDLDFLMLLVPLSRAHGRTQGDFVLNAQGKLRWPNAGEQADVVFTGVELMHRRVFANAPQGAFRLRQLWDQSIGADAYFTRIGTVIFDGDWIDVGDLPALEAAERMLG